MAVRINIGAKIKILFAACAALFFIALSSTIGSSNINIIDIVRIIASKLFFQSAWSNNIDGRIITIIWTIRLPRTLLAFLVGGCISISGVVVQSVLKNSLASPYTLGVSSGASFGAALFMLSGLTVPFLSSFSLPLLGFVFGLVTVCIVVFFSSRLDKSFSNNTVILFGMVVSLFINALLTTLLALYRDELKNLIIWQMGSFANRGWSYIQLLLPFFLVGTAGVVRLCREMDILTFGDEYASSAGMEVKSVKGQLFFFSTVLTGGAVALSGTIGFVDLIAPHVARRFVGSMHNAVVPMSFFIGGIICIAADIAARTVVRPSELPVGAITALVGAPFFVWVYFGRRGR